MEQKIEKFEQSLQKAKISIQDFDFFYGNFQALHKINMEIPENKITAFIGPSGCGKSTLLKSLNRMNDMAENFCYKGKILFAKENALGSSALVEPAVSASQANIEIAAKDNFDANQRQEYFYNILDKKTDLNLLRKKVGMVFQKPNPFPMSIYDNIAYGPRTHGIKRKSELDEIVEKSLKAAAIWDEAKDRLNKSALGMSGGQQQRLCIARALAVNPEVLLMDEPTSALDPISTGKIEDLCDELKEKLTIVIVTHNMQQAARISDRTAFFLLGKIVEYGETEQIFSTPKDKKTEEYITGRFG